MRTCLSPPVWVKNPLFGVPDGFLPLGAQGGPHELEQAVGELSAPRRLVAEVSLIGNSLRFLGSDLVSGEKKEIKKSALPGRGRGGPAVQW